MNERVLNTVEYNKIIDRLVEKATCEPGRALCRDLLPMSELYDIELAQRETETAVTYIFRKGPISFGSTRDFSYTFSALSIEQTLTAPELLHIASFLDNVSRVSAYGVFDKDAPEDDALKDLFACLYPIRQLSNSINRCIISEEEIADDASPALHKIRRAMLSTNDKIHSQLQKLVNVGMGSYMQDNIITMRDNRYCLPVKSEYKNQVRGIVHDQSSTGSTLFIEPASVVELNNQLRTLAIDEQKEIEKILAELSAEAASHLPELKANYNNMVKLDFVFAKASLALDQDATRPIFNQEHYIDIRNGRHPLIDKKKVVPTNISIGRDYNMIIITGPNTGGKTVSLKTVGLFELMGMAGLHIPASSQSSLSIFREIFADIGDEQSIEQNLSTFSSHMVTIVDIFKRVDSDCLCLFDELGAGTDPTEGAALAISILNFLHVRGITSLATTHYSELKVYAMRTEGIVNASCEFNVETLQPTYRLTIGIPGKSNAFAISKRLGLPGYIIETAKEQLSQETQNFEQILSDLEEEKRTARKEREAAESLRISMEKQKKDLQQREKQLNDKKDQILRKANEQARDILQEAKETADEAISELRKSQKGDSASMERTRNALREKVSKKNSKLAIREAVRTGHLTADDIRIGDRVKIMSMGLKGTVHSLPDKSGKLYVTCGIMQTQARITDLELMGEDDLPVTKSTKSGSAMKKAFGDGGSSSGKMNFDRSMRMSSEINLLGMTTDEALITLDKYLDDARMSHLETVRVVHGKGTGALRNAVTNYLRKQKWVKSYRAGDFGEGDAGVTIVTL